MCLIIHAGKKTPISENILKTAKERNRDGWGVCWFADGRLHAKKSLDMDKLISFVSKLEDYERIVHLRMTTHGHTNMNNCHPFKVADGLFFMHNGVMSEFDKVKDGRSDTAQFVHSILSPMVQRNGSEVLSEFWFRNILDKYASPNQRFALMDAHGRVFRAGSWTKHESGVYLSNTYAWGEVKKHTTYGNYLQRGSGTISHNLDDTKKWRHSKDYDEFWANNVKKYLGEIDETPKVDSKFYETTELTFTAEDFQNLPEEDAEKFIAENPEFFRNLLDEANKKKE